MNKKTNSKSIPARKTSPRTAKKKKKAPTSVKTSSAKAKAKSKGCKKDACGPSSAAAAPTDEVLRMSPDDMAQVELTRTKLALIMESIKVRDLQKEKLEWESAAKTATLTQEKFALESQQVKLQGDLAKILEDLSPKYNIDLKKCAYDDDGVIRKVED